MTSRKQEIARAEGLHAWGCAAKEIAEGFRQTRSYRQASKYQAIYCVSFTRFRALMNSDRGAV